MGNYLLHENNATNSRRVFNPRLLSTPRRKGQAMNNLDEHLERHYNRQCGLSDTAKDDMPDEERERQSRLQSDREMGWDD